MKKILFITATVLFSLNACEKYNSYLPNYGSEGNTIKAGPAIDVLYDVMSSWGGTISVADPGNPLDGMEIIAEPNTFNTYTNFKISYAEIKSHSLGPYFNPVSPLITINDGGGFADKPIKVKIPIKLPQGHFAMGFFYDDKSGKVEGLPIDSLGTDFIIVSTRHFSSGSTSLKSSGTSGGQSFATMVISSEQESELNKQTIISSGFSPGTDDWEFTNWGSYLSPGGICAGHSISAMWYYYEKRLKGGKYLFHGYDEFCNPVLPAAMWQDNPLGYRFASTVQEDCNFGNWVNSIAVKSYLGRSNWYAFLLSMLVTGEPQLAVIRQSIPDYAGHAVVIYKINVTEGKLYVADPNFPNNRESINGTETIRTIDFVNGSFAPYPSALNAASSRINFDQIGYFAKTAFVDWARITSRWAEFEAGTIGNDRFPNYQLYVNSTKESPLIDNINVDDDVIDIVCKSSEFPKYIASTDYLQEFEVFNAAGEYVSSGTAANKGVARIKLKTGKNKFGFYISGLIGKPFSFVDYKWIIINYNTLFIRPDPLSGYVNTEYSLYAGTNGSLPANSKFVWNFGDNKPEVTRNNDSTVVHQYEYPGEYIVTVKLYDNSDNKEIGTAFSNVQIRNKYETLFIDPEHLYGKINQEYTFTARTNGDIPPDYKFVWEFGDDTPAVTRIKDSTVTHTFTRDGEHYIYLALYDNSTGELINTKAASVTISSGLLEKVKAAEWVGLVFSGDFKYTDYSLGGSFSLAQYLFLKPGEYSLSWSANSFNFDFRKKAFGYYEWDSTLVYGNMKGELSADGNTILWLTGYKVESNMLGTDSVNYKIELGNLQYSHMIGPLIYYEARGPGVANIISKVEISRRRFSGEPWNAWIESHLVSVDYNSSSTPYLTVEFFPKN